MFKTTQELQDFLLWCQQAKIKAVKVGDMEVQFSDLAFIDVISQIAPQNEERETSKTLVDTAPDESDEDLLFWSAKN
jgi:hypothetical protein